MEPDEIDELLNLIDSIHITFYYNSIIKSYVFKPDILLYSNGRMLFSLDYAWKHYTCYKSSIDGKYIYGVITDPLLIKEKCEAKIIKMLWK